MNRIFQHFQLQETPSELLTPPDDNTPQRPKSCGRRPTITPPNTLERRKPPDYLIHAVAAPPPDLWASFLVVGKALTDYLPLPAPSASLCIDTSVDRIRERVSSC